MESQHAAAVGRERVGEQGFAMILALLFTVIVVGITVTGTLILRSHQAKTKTSFVSRGQASMFAKSGLIEALGWMRKQASQPVLNFVPILDEVAVPEILDTIEPEVGIVREFQINGPIWGRYEVWKDWSTDPNATRLAWRNQFRCQDISSYRNEPSGTIWKLCSVGYVFRRTSATAAFDAAPNQVLGQEIMEVEVRRLAIQPPGQAALNISNAATCQILTKGKVLGGNTAAGIYYATGTGNVTISGTGASVTGVPSLSAAANYNGSIDAVFGVSIAELRAMANYVITNASQFPSPVPKDTIVICDVPITFDENQPLKGTGVVVCTSSVTINQASYSAFNGLLYVAGSFTLREPAEITGATVVVGSVLVQGSADSSSLTFDDGILNHLRTELGSYRMSSAFIRSRARHY
ncbi:MAG: hypothetical protein NT107_14060 [Planctomycetota bacterium]|nr:hypothetical protein [Planctomycetota bacterium]